MRVPLKLAYRVVKDLIGLCLSLQELTWADFVYMSVGARGIFCVLFSVLEGAAALAEAAFVRIICLQRRTANVFTYCRTPLSVFWLQVLYSKGISSR
jgi:hypothetical protein